MTKYRLSSYATPYGQVWTVICQNGHTVCECRTRANARMIAKALNGGIHD